MHIKPVALAAIVVGLLALVGGLDGIRRQFMRDPMWAAQNWRSILTGAAIWVLVGGLALLGGVVAQLA
jgi:hypothetical protein